MHWILQTNIFNEAAYEVLLERINYHKLPHSIHKVIPFIGELTPDPVLDTKNAICLGSYSMRHTAKKLGLYPGVFDLEPFDFQVQLSKWGSHMLNYDSVVKPFGDVMLEDFTTEEMFIRPIHDSKVFTGKLFHKQDFFEWKVKVCVLEEDDGSSLRKDTLIQICTPKKIFSEHRFWVVKGKIVTSSTYKIGKNVVYQSLPFNSVFEEFAKDRIKEWQPHDAFVIDVADTSDGMKVVEINTLNSCGFYAADIDRLILALDDNFSEASCESHV
jgi:hypothetical protein